MKTMCNQQFSDSPSINTEYILVTPLGKMEARAATKGLYSGCQISYVNFYLSEQHQKQKKPCGAIIVYVRQDCLVKMFQAMGFPIVDDKDLALISDVCGEFCNIIAGGFKNALANLGYTNLIMSAPITSTNDIVEGVGFSLEQEKYHELSFYFWNLKAFVVDVTLAPIPMRKK